MTIDTPPACRDGFTRAFGTNMKRFFNPFSFVIASHASSVAGPSRARGAVSYEIAYLL